MMAMDLFLSVSEEAGKTGKLVWHLFSLVRN
jgi:hypothetical protein